MQDKELDKRRRCFQDWDSHMRSHIQAHGFWCDAVDPRSGYAMHGTHGAQYSEAIGAQVFLSYTVQKAGMCSMIVHPQHGVHVYPATFFTTAPLVHVQAALAGACAAHNGFAAHGENSDHQEALLSVSNVTVLYAPWGHFLEVGSTSARQAGCCFRCAARDVSFEVFQGKTLMIRGTPGVGKSTLLLALRGLVPLQHGKVTWGRGVRAMFVPQTSLLAPNSCLSAQLAYPEQSCTEDEARALLQEVGLEYLWERQRAFVDSDQGAASLKLSGGELQCLGIARVLRARPDIVLLDEAFSAVSAEVEARLMCALQAANVTVVMVSHRDSSISRTTAVLTLDWDLPNGWLLEDEMTL
jgi:ABC-type multidrug transport system fused ATPase/permease subunit